MKNKLPVQTKGYLELEREYDALMDEHITVKDPRFLAGLEKKYELIDKMNKIYVEIT